ncbi:dnaJ homolog subfamily B member 4 [Prunus yedoensis var. nudiflora]|uniref:DnaJ homolog subfamily B member 4 n=1 Tax=Prunus yedoensis var. nudiflora TaxID=2094558 RepID=A0A314ZII9_PRUYE|nr:dnaJ homolog subfamily B member 4 [Prunus yedoensis var. nudiflora]
MFSSFGDGRPMTQAPRKASPIEKRLPCSLEELYKGTTKKMKISREIADASGKTLPVEEILTIEIKPGWKKGTKITFPEKGNEQGNHIHKGWQRPCCHTEDLPSRSSHGLHVHLTTLDGRTLTIPINNVIHPDYVEVVPKEGMPIPKDPSKKGNLRIKFNIKFPTRLSSEQKAGIKKLLAA